MSPAFRAASQPFTTTVESSLNPNLPPVIDQIPYHTRDDHQTTHYRYIIKQSISHPQPPYPTTLNLSTFPGGAGKFGDVMDVFIPQKLNKKGNRFAFIRFNRPGNVHALTEKISTVQADGINLGASLARNRSVQSGTNANNNTTSRVQRRHDQVDHVAPQNKSYVETVHGTAPAPPRTENVSQSTTGQIYIPREASPSWLDQCILAVMKNPIPIHSITAMVHTSINKEVSVIPMGGVSSLLRFQTTKEMNEVLRNTPKALSQICSEFRQWKTDDCTFNRLCWVLIRSTPPCVWNDEFFGAVVACVGVMVDCSQDTRSQTRLDVAEVLILTTDFGFVNRSLSVNIGGKQYNIGIMETQYDPLDWAWLPSFLSTTANTSPHGLFRQSQQTSKSPLINPSSHSRQVSACTSSSGNPNQLD
ncbi:hypothetical protein Tsubulata_026617 [Turnera subulata]|uniref:RRM domain-containing protein n=1 Tax=Turnera subulata TaxID=218843 RepID=A0A9Q0F469_9ROSI|nr:hypothetical protein Tsubulata_026617 [Turnera subulata]